MTFVLDTGTTRTTTGVTSHTGASSPNFAILASCCSAHAYGSNTNADARLVLGVMAGSDQFMIGSDSSHNAGTSASYKWSSSAATYKRYNVAGTLQGEASGAFTASGVDLDFHTTAESAALKYSLLYGTVDDAEIVIADIPTSGGSAITTTITDWDVCIVLTIGLTAATTQGTSSFNGVGLIDGTAARGVSWWSRNGQTTSDTGRRYSTSEPVCLDFNSSPNIVCSVSSRASTSWTPNWTSYPGSTRKMACVFLKHSDGIKVLESSSPASAATDETLSPGFQMGALFSMSSSLTSSTSNARQFTAFGLSQDSTAYQCYGVMDDDNEPTLTDCDRDHRDDEGVMVMAAGGAVALAKPKDITSTDFKLDYSSVSNGMLAAHLAFGVPASGGPAPHHILRSNSLAGGMNGLGL